ncbi:MAG: hypothetical protein ACM3N7_01900, partial [Planctomycetaceae bacterium]
MKAVFCCQEDCIPTLYFAPAYYSFSKILVVIIDKIASEKEIEKRRFQERRLRSAESSDPVGIPLAVLN